MLHTSICSRAFESFTFKSCISRCCPSIKLSCLEISILWMSSSDAKKSFCSTNLSRCSVVATSVSLEIGQKKSFTFLLRSQSEGKGIKYTPKLKKVPLSWDGRGVNSNVNFQNSLSCPIDFFYFPSLVFKRNKYDILRCGRCWVSHGRTHCRVVHTSLKDPLWSNSRANELLHLVKVHGATKNNKTCRCFGELLDHALRRTNV